MEGRPNRAVVSTSDLNGHLHQQSDFESFTCKKKREKFQKKSSNISHGSFFKHPQRFCQDQGKAHSLFLSSVEGQVRGERSPMAACILSSHQERRGHSPYRGHKIRNIADQAKSKSNIPSSTRPTVLLFFFFCLREMSLGSGSPLVFNSAVGGVLRPIMTPLVLLSPLAACTKCQ